MFGRVSLAELLINKGASLNSKDEKKETPLDLALIDWARRDGARLAPEALERKKDVARVLKKHGARKGRSLHDKE
jgi:hypothetical protein